MIAAKNYITSLGLDSDHTAIYTDMGNDGVKIETTYIINQYRDSEPVRYRVRNGLIYTMRWKKGKMSKGYELATYELDGSINLIKK